MQRQMRPKSWGGRCSRMTRPGRGQGRQKRGLLLASAPTCRSSARSNVMVQLRSSAESKASCAPQISRSAMARRSRATSLHRPLQSAAASRALSVPSASSCRTVVRSRVIFFIGRCRLTRTLSLKDRRGGLRIQRTYLRVLTPKSPRKKTWPRPRYRPWTPSWRMGRSTRRDLLERLEPFSPERQLEMGEAGNITGFTHFELAFGGKWFEALKEIAPSASAHPPTRRPWTVTGPGPRLFSGGLWRQHSKIGPLDSQPAATILQTECSRQSTTTDEKYHPRPHHRSAA